VNANGEETNESGQLLQPTPSGTENPWKFDEKINFSFNPPKIGDDDKFNNHAKSMIIL